MVFHEDFPAIRVLEEQAIEMDELFLERSVGQLEGVEEDAGFMRGGGVAHAFGKAEFDAGFSSARFGIDEFLFPPSKRHGQRLAHLFVAADEDTFWVTGCLIGLEVPFPDGAGNDGPIRIEFC